MGSLRRIAIFFIVLIALQDAHTLNIKPKVEKLNEFKSTEVEEQGKSRSKRWVSAVLFGTAIIVSMANIAFDIYLIIEGCCGIYPDACTYEELYKNSMYVINNKSQEIDETWDLASNLMTYVQASNSRNDEIAVELKRITQSYENIVEVIDPEIINKLNNLTSDIEDQIEAKNETILLWGNSEVTTAYSSLFDSQIGTITILSGLIGNVVEGVTNFAWNWYKTKQIQIALTAQADKLFNVKYSKATKLLGMDGIDDFIDQTAVSTRKADVANSKGSTYLSYASNIFHLIQIGVEIWMAILKVEQCETVRDDVKDAYETVAPYEEEIIELQANVTEYYANLTEYYTDIKTQASDEQFFEYIEQIKNLTDHSSVETVDMVSASAYFQLYMDSVGGVTDWQDFYEMQGTLIESLEKVTFVLECYEKKVKTYQVVKERCAEGYDTLVNIFTQVVSEFDTNDDDCSVNATLVYTSYEDTETYINSLAASEGFNADCPLNNDDQQALVCSKKCDGDSNAVIAESLSISETYVELFAAQCGSYCALSTDEINAICILENSAIPLATMLTLYPQADPDEVESIYLTCDGGTTPVTTTTDSTTSTASTTTTTTTTTTPTTTTTTTTPTTTTTTTTTTTPTTTTTTTASTRRRRRRRRRRWLTK